MSGESSSDHPGSNAAIVKGSASSRSAAHHSKSRFSAARRSVSGLSDRGLLSATDRLVRTERLTTLEVLLHLNEVEKRELYLTLGCGSMFDYCVSHLGYSRSAAWRRIHSARCIVRFPEAYELVENDALNLTTLSMVAAVLTNSNKNELLDQVRGQSQDKVQKILAAYQPPCVYRDRVKPVRVAVPAPEDSAPTDCAHSSEPEGLEFNTAHRPDGESRIASHHGVGQTDSNESSSKGPGPTSIDTAIGRSTRRYMLETQLLIQFVASETFMTKYQEARSLLSNKLPEVSFETVFDAAIDAFLDKHSPARRQARREKRAVTKKQTTHKNNAPKPRRLQTRAVNLAVRADQLSRKKFDEQCRSGTDIMLTKTSDGPTKDHAKGRQSKTTQSVHDNTAENCRHIQAKTKDAVFIRDKSRCTHVGSNGKRCSSTHRLHIDHIVPYARGGTNALSNLRLLCAKHNKLEAKRIYGAAKIDSYCKRE